MEDVRGLYEFKQGLPKRLFPLLRIDIMVGASVGHQFLTFMDVFFGYSQIFIHPSDQKKTSFITEHCTYSYNVMSFGLKNAGATYHKLVNKIIKDEIGKSMEVYVDDMKSPKKQKDIPKLKGRVVALNRFVSKST